MLGDAPHMQYAGANVNLTITTDSIILMIMESGEVNWSLFKQSLLDTFLLLIIFEKIVC